MIQCNPSGHTSWQRKCQYLPPHISLFQMPEEHYILELPARQERMRGVRRDGGREQRWRRERAVVKKWRWGRERMREKDSKMRGRDYHYTPLGLTYLFTFPLVEGSIINTIIFHWLQITRAHRAHTPCRINWLFVACSLYTYLEHAFS